MDSCVSTRWVVNSRIRHSIHSSRFIADPNFAYKTTFSSFILLSHSSMLSLISETSLSIFTMSRSRRFCARESGNCTNASPTRYLYNKNKMSIYETYSFGATHSTGSSSSANSSSMERSSRASFSCCSRTLNVDIAQKEVTEPTFSSVRRSSNPLWRALSLENVQMRCWSSKRTCRYHSVESVFMIDPELTPGHFNVLILFLLAKLCGINMSVRSSPIGISSYHTHLEVDHRERLQVKG